MVWQSKGSARQQHALLSSLLGNRVKEVCGVCVEVCTRGEHKGSGLAERGMEDGGSMGKGLILLSFMEGGKDEEIKGKRRSTKRRRRVLLCRRDREKEMKTLLLSCRLLQSVIWEEGVAGHSTYVWKIAMR